MTIWKFGCNWGGHDKDFYEFIRDESIVIGHNPDANYSLDDLVLVTKGFKVLAIVQVEEKPRSITESSYRFVTNQYGIPWDSSSLYAQAEWYVFPVAKQFEYRVQRGACKVRRAEIIQTTRELWKNRS